MEFTYEGIVRHGFGFYNPNHAAALINLLIPFAWLIAIRFRNPLVKCIGYIIGIVLPLGLALTFSRTGFVILFVEALLFFLLFILSPVFDRKQTIHAASSCLSTVLVFLLAALACGTFSRASSGIIHPDASVTNRFLIWKGGFQLFADNPLGVGLGNSGLLYTHFLAPGNSGIHCQTLVNSWLTFLAETGIVFSFILFFFLFLAFFCGIGKWLKTPDANTLTYLTAFISVILSGMMSSCLNVNLLCDFQNFGQLTVMNFALSWLYCILFLGTIILLVKSGSMLSKKTVMAFLFTVMLLAALWIIGKTTASPESVKVVRDRSDIFAHYQQNSHNTSSILALPDDNRNLEESIYFLRQQYPESAICIPLKSWQLKTNIPMLPSERLVLFGHCGFLAKQYSDKKTDLVSPPETISLTNNIDRIFLRRFVEENSALKQAANEKDISITLY